MCDLKAFRPIGTPRARKESDDFRKKWNELRREFMEVLHDDRGEE